MQIDALWSNLVPFRADWCTLVQLGGVSWRLVYIGATWCPLVQIGAVWWNLVQIVAVWCTFVHFRENWEFGATWCRCAF